MLKWTVKQKEYLDNANKTYNFKIGAIRSGKTFQDTEHIIPMRIRSMIGKEGIIMIIGVTEATLERNVLRPMRDKFGPDLVSLITKNRVKLFGEWCYALGAEKISQLSKIKGSGAKYIYGDEVAKWNEEVFLEIVGRLDKEHSLFEGTANPEYPSHWLKKWLEKDVDAYIQKYHLDDNTFLPEKVRNNIKRAYAGTVLYDRFVLGEWVNAEGTIYRLFADNPEHFIHKGDLPRGQTIIGIDYGGTKSGQAFVCVRIAEDYKKVVVMRTKKILDLLDDKKLLDEQLKFIHECRRDFGTEIDYIYPDNAEPTHIRSLSNECEKLYPHTIVRGCWKVPINERITATTMMLSFDRLSYIEGECDSFVKAMNEALWDSNTYTSERQDVRLDDFTSDIDTLDAFEYTFERDIREIIDTMEGDYA